MPVENRTRERKRERERKRRERKKGEREKERKKEKEREKEKEKVCACACVRVKHAREETIAVVERRTSGEKRDLGERIENRKVVEYEVSQYEQSDMDSLEFERGYWTAL